VDDERTDHEAQERWRRVFKAVHREVRPVGQRWFQEYGSYFYDLAEEELAAFSTAMVRGPAHAHAHIAAQMTREEWDLYVQSTTKGLLGIARRRATILDALEDLGPKLLRAIGTAILGAL
jgi:hypothetical protein